MYNGYPETKTLTFQYDSSSKIMTFQYKTDLKIMTFQFSGAATGRYEQTSFKSRGDVYSDQVKSEFI